MSQGQAQQIGVGHLTVPHKRFGESVIDLATRSIAATWGGDSVSTPLPTEVALSADGARLFLFSRGFSSGAASIRVFDTATGEQLANLPGFSEVSTLSLDPNGERMYALNSDLPDATWSRAATLVAIDTDRLAVVTSVPLGRTFDLIAGDIAGGLLSPRVGTADLATAAIRAAEAERDAVRAQFAQKNQQIAALTTENTGLRAQVSTLTAEKTGLQGQVDTLTIENTSLRTQVSALSAQNTGLEAQVDRLTTESTGLRTQVSTLTTENIGLHTQVSTLTTENTQVRAVISALTTENVGLHGQIDTLTGQNAQLTTDLAAANARVSTLTGEKTALQTQVETLSGQNAQLTTDLGTARQTIIARDATIIERDATIAGLRTDLATANQAIRSLTQQLTAANTTLAALTAEVASLQQLLRSVFGDPAFVVPGATLQEQISNLIAAINRLNHGQQQALYKNLGGTKK